MIKRVVVKSSEIQGSGVFAEEDISTGDVVMIWSIDFSVISEAEYNREQRAGNQLMIKTGARYVDGCFLYTDDKPRVENYMNHSFEPNLLYHCGICFARCDIKSGDELTVNYRYVLAKGDYGAFVDTKTGQFIDGIDSLTCLKETTNDLANILQKIKSAD